MATPLGPTYEDYVACVPPANRHKMQQELDCESGDGVDLHLGELAHLLVDWELLAPKLGLSDVDISDVHSDNRSAELERIDALKKSKSTLGPFNATYGTYLKIFVENHKAKGALKCAEKIVMQLGATGGPSHSRSHAAQSTAYPPQPPPLSPPHSYMLSGGPQQTPVSLSTLPLYNGRTNGPQLQAAANLPGQAAGFPPAPYGGIGYQQGYQPGYHWPVYQPMYPQGYVQYPGYQQHTGPTRLPGADIAVATPTYCQQPVNEGSSGAGALDSGSNPVVHMEVTSHSSVARESPALPTPPPNPSILNIEFGLSNVFDFLKNDLSPNDYLALALKLKLSKVSYDKIVLENPNNSDNVLAGIIDLWIKNSVKPKASREWLKQALSEVHPALAHKI